MERLSASAWMIWGAVLVAQPIAIYLVRKGEKSPLRRSVLAFISFQMARSATLLLLYLIPTNPYTHAYVYFWTYWPLTFLSELFELWVLVEIAREPAEVSPQSRKIATSIASAIVVGSLVFCFGISRTVHGAFYMEITQVVMEAQRAVSLTWCLSLISIAAIAEFFGMDWSRGAKGVMCGFAADALGTAIYSWSFSFLGLRALPALAEMKDLFYFAALAIWAISSLRRYPVDVIPEGAEELLRRCIDANLATVERMRRRRS